MKKTIYTLLLSGLMLVSCGESPQSENPANQSPRPRMAQSNAQPMTNASSHYFSKTEGASMATSFREALAAGTLKADSFPKSMFIEKKHIEFLLDALDENSGGIIFYPVIAPGSGHMSLALAPVTFDVDEAGDYTTSTISVLYPEVEGNPSVLERLIRCPDMCPSSTTDLYNQ